MTEAVSSLFPVLPGHLYATVFLIAAIDSTGVPFPGRLLLVIAGTRATSGSQAALAILFAAGGALAGDHLLYLLGRLGGPRIHRLYCRWAMTSGRCRDQARRYVERYGAAAIILGRFVATVRLLTALLAGAGAIPYLRFLAFDALGALLWSAALVLLGYFAGRRAIELVGGQGTAELLLVVVAVGTLAVAGYRWWRRSRHAAGARRRAPLGV